MQIYLRTEMKTLKIKSKGKFLVKNTASSRLYGQSCFLTIARLHSSILNDVSSEGLEDLVVDGRAWIRLSLALCLELLSPPACLFQHRLRVGSRTYRRATVGALVGESVGGRFSFAPGAADDGVSLDSAEGR